MLMLVHRSCFVILSSFSIDFFQTGVLLGGICTKVIKVTAGLATIGKNQISWLRLIMPQLWCLELGKMQILKNQVLFAKKESLMQRVN